MKLVYTEIGHSLTQELVQMAADWAQKGKRVFYIAPNSLSFEKERAVLSHLEEQATFSILVTRFAQMARYFTLHEPIQAETIDEIGLTMVFYRILAELPDDALRLYGRMRSDMAFIQQLVSLYQEMQRSNVTIEDLLAMDHPDKQADLELIFTGVTAYLQEEEVTYQTPIRVFREAVLSGKLDQELADVVLVVDGFTRFSAEEESLVEALEGRVTETVIGTYASQKAYQATYIEGNVYQAGVDFLRHLAQRFSVKPVFLSLPEGEGRLTKISRNIERLYDYSGQLETLTEEDKQDVLIWEVSSQQEELEQVAVAIRQQLHQGHRYKDILVLLGDVASYQLQLKQVFDKYAIPFYLGRAEEMSAHPLVHLVESLDRLKRYRFRSEDVIQLLRSGLFGHLDDREIDKFEQYILFADVKGIKAFGRDFTLNVHDAYDLPVLNAFRQAIMVPLVDLFSIKKQPARQILSRLMDFFTAIGLTDNMSRLAQGKNAWEQEKDEEVWKAFTKLLERIHRLFGQTALTLEEVLTLLRVGMQASHYRTIPATVDVVNVRSYELVEPHSAPFVYAIGLTPGNFPKKIVASSLLTEEERSKVNVALERTAYFDQTEADNLKKNHAAMLSLVHSATQQLVLSAPRWGSDGEEARSPYLKLLRDMGIPCLKKEGQDWSTLDVGTSKSLLSRLIALNQFGVEDQLTADQKTFWTVMLRYIGKKMAQEGISIPAISDRITSQLLQSDTLAALYPTDEALKLSASSLKDFYDNQYLYFVRHILRLEEARSIHPDARSHGNFLHRILEKTLVASPEDRENQLQVAIQETQAEPLFQALYQSDAQGQLTQEVLVDIAQATVEFLQQNQAIQVLEQEAGFGQQGSPDFTLPSGQAVRLRGKIDRLDALVETGALGIVDYKSGAHDFRLEDFYNGLSPQLLTYLTAVAASDKGQQAAGIFGAMYLHLQHPLVSLSDLGSIDEVGNKVNKDLTYKGLFVEEWANQLGSAYHTTKNSLYTKEQVASLMAHHHRLCQEAATIITKGQFAINPYTKDGRSVEGQQLKAITGFEANRHLGQARRLVKGGKKEDWFQRMEKGEDK